SHSADAVILATGGYGNVFYLSTNAKGCNVTAAFRAYKKGALFSNPCFTQIHPTCIPVAGSFQSKLTLMSESLRNDGRCWVAKVQALYGNLFDMYHQITAENGYEQPMRVYPAVHYTMGGLWVDYDLMSNVPGLFVLGEANFSDHGANRLGASALMQGLADGYF